MQDIEENLENVGFSEKQIKIVLSLLELGEATVIEIAKKAGLKRTTVYNLLPQFIRKGLVTVAIRKKRKVFFIENLSQLKAEAEEKVGLINGLLPELKARQNVIVHKPRIRFYEGLGGMKELYGDTLSSSNAGDTILSFTGLSDFYKLVSKSFSRFYISERVKQKIRIKIIAPPSKVTDEWAANAQKELREIKIVRDARFQFNADVEIYADKVALISYKEDFLGVIIESKEINQMQRMAFEIMWNALK